MPELPEVEHFRTLLLPLVSSSSSQEKQPLKLERCSLHTKPPRRFVTDDEVARINRAQFTVSEILRKGKLIVMKLENQKNDTARYLLVHMGMTGRISTPNQVPQLESLKDKDYPPPHTYIKFSTGTHEACFSDPRKFGSIVLADSMQEFHALAPDAWLEGGEKETQQELVEQLANQSTGIKAILLDQKRVVSGVGNWVADEILYQARIHPDQANLSPEEASRLLKIMHSILSTAILCLIEKNEPFPKDWMFHYRWNKKKTTKDAQGRAVTFVTSGGRTSAIVPSIQKQQGRAKISKSRASSTKKNDRRKAGPSHQEKSEPSIPEAKRRRRQRKRD